MTINGSLNGVKGYIAWLLFMAGFAWAVIEYHGHQEYARKDVLEQQMSPMQEDVREIKGDMKEMNRMILDLWRRAQ